MSPFAFFGLVARWIVTGPTGLNGESHPRAILRFTLLVVFIAVMITGIIGVGYSFNALMS